MKDIKTIVKIAAAAVFLFLCSIIPSWFAPAVLIAPESAPPTETVYRSIDDFSERAALFNAHFDENAETDKIKGVSFAVEELDEAETLRLENMIIYITDTLNVDEAPARKTLSEGANLFSIYDRGSGAYIRVIQYYDSWLGDWQNWIHLIIDVDTLDIYYLYISSACIGNHSKYGRDMMPEPYTLLSFLIDYTGFVPANLSETRDDGDTVLTASFGPSGQPAEYIYNIKGHFNYDESIPVKDFDYKITCELDATLMREGITKDAND